MQNSTGKPYVIVVGIDYSETGDEALEQALRLANERENAEPHVIHVAATFGGALHVDLPSEARTLSIDEAVDHLRKHVAAKLAGFQSRLSGAVNFKRVVTHQRVGEPAEEITQLARELDAELVVTGTHGRRGVMRWAVGSVAEEVVGRASCPVLVVRARQTQAAADALPSTCSRCALERSRTGGAELWCDEHRAEHAGRNQYRYVPSVHGAADGTPV